MLSIPILSCRRPLYSSMWHPVFSVSQSPHDDHHCLDCRGILSAPLRCPIDFATLIATLIATSLWQRNINCPLQCILQVNSSTAVYGSIKSFILDNVMRDMSDLYSFNFSRCTLVETPTAGSLWALAMVRLLTCRWDMVEGGKDMPSRSFEWDRMALQ